MVSPPSLDVPRVSSRRSAPFLPPLVHDATARGVILMFGVLKSLSSGLSPSRKIVEFFYLEIVFSRCICDFPSMRVKAEC